MPLREFEVFQRRRTGSRSSAIVLTVHETILYLSAGAHAAINRSPFAVLYYDRDTDAIGIKGATQRSSSSYTVSSARQINCRSFLRWAEPARGRRIGSLVDDMLVFNAPKAVQ